VTRASLENDAEDLAEGCVLFIYVQELLELIFSKMHFSIPNTKELTDSSGSHYTGSICAL